jgi:cation diffusion facilitator family transporter
LERKVLVMKQGNVKVSRGSGVGESETRIAMRVSILSVIVNLALSLFKFIAGILASSGAMISDAVHSASDVFSTFIVMIGVSIAGKKADKEHPYGHERLECVAAIILAVVLAATGLGVGWKGITNIINGNYASLPVPGLLALIAALVSIVVKEWMYWFTRAAARKINSSALMADAWHHRSDSFSSIGAFIGIFGSRLGFPVLDSVASVIICIFIEKAAIDIFRDAIGKLVDKSAKPEEVEAIKKTILSIPEVKGIDDVKTRLFGNKVYVDVEIALDGNETLYKAHATAEKVHDAIEKDFSEVKHCMVHVNPK